MNLNLNHKLTFDRKICIWCEVVNLYCKYMCVFATLGGKTSEQTERL